MDLKDDKTVTISKYEEAHSSVKGKLKGAWNKILSLSRGEASNGKSKPEKQ